MGIIKINGKRTLILFDDRKHPEIEEWDDENEVWKISSLTFNQDRMCFAHVYKSQAFWISFSLFNSSYPIFAAILKYIASTKRMAKTIVITDCFDEKKGPQSIAILITTFHLLGVITFSVNHKRIKVQFLHSMQAPISCDDLTIFYPIFPAIFGHSWNVLSCVEWQSFSDNW